MALKLRTRTRIPAALVASSPINITKNGLTYSFTWDPTGLAPLTNYDPTAKYALVYDPSTGVSNTVQLSAIVGQTTSTDLDGIGSTRGSVLYRGASGWSALTPGTVGYTLQSGGAGADPSWTNNALTPGNGLTSTLTATAPGSAISAGTLSSAQLINAQTGTTYTFLDGDRAKLVTSSNASAQAYTLPQAGAASAFQAGWFVDIQNISTNVAGIVTIIPTTSTIKGVATYKVHPGQSARIVSDGTNYQVKDITAAQLPGTTTNDAANTGNVGEYVSSSIASGSAVSLTTATAANITSISLTAGDWDVSGNIAFFSATSGVTDFSGWISTTSATLPTAPNGGSFAKLTISFNSIGASQVMPIGRSRLSLSTTTTVYLSTQCVFANTASAFGFIGARRVR